MENYVLVVKCLTKSEGILWKEKLGNIDIDIKNIMLLGGMMNDIIDKDVDKIIKEHKC